MAIDHDQPREHLCEVAIPAHWRGERGARIDDKWLRISCVGRADGPVAVVLGGISADRFVARSQHGSGGWWADIVRAGGAIDLNRWRCVSLDFAPLSPATPVDLTTADYADLLAIALRGLEIERVDALVGASFGAMVGLAFAAREPARVGKLVAVSAGDRPRPMATALRRVQRRVLDLGLAVGEETTAVAIARELAMTTYRTADEFAARFDGPDAVESYLASRGAAYAAQNGAARYRTLSNAIDRHRVDAARIVAPSLLVGVAEDRLVPLADVAATRARLGGRARLEIISSVYGHDAFLKETAAIGAPIRAFLEETTQ
ncbi:MAG: homoserine O-succinyltransferase [Parvularculaceae bacterium]